MFFAREVLQDRNLAQRILVQPSPRLPDLLSAHFLSQQQNKGSHIHEEGHKGFLHLLSAVLALIFLARRIQPSLSLVDRRLYV